MTQFGKAINEYITETRLLWVGSQLDDYLKCAIPYFHYQMDGSGDDREIRVDRIRTARMLAGIQALPLKKR